MLPLSGSTPACRLSRSKKLMMGALEKQARTQLEQRKRKQRRGRLWKVLIARKSILGNVCVTYSSSCMHAHSAPKFIISGLPARKMWGSLAPSAVWPWTGPELTLPLIKAYKLGFNATVAWGLCKLCAWTANGHGCLLWTGCPRGEEYEFCSSQCADITKERKI